MHSAPHGDLSCEVSTLLALILMRLCSTRLVDTIIACRRPYKGNDVPCVMPARLKTLGEPTQPPGRLKRQRL